MDRFLLGFKETMAIHISNPYARVNYQIQITTPMNSDIKPDFEKLISCPFCGGLPEIKQTGKLKMRIRCTKCHIGLEQKVLRFSLEWLHGSLTESWNKREVSIELLEALQKILTHTRDNTTYQIAKEAIDKRFYHVEPLLSTVKRLQEENEQYKATIHNFNNMCQQRLQDQLNTILLELHKLKEENEQLKEEKNELVGMRQLVAEIIKWTQVKDGRAIFTTSEETFRVYEKYLKSSELNKEEHGE